jgi:hypothetical protein
LADAVTQLDNNQFRARCAGGRIAKLRCLQATLGFFVPRYRCNARMLTF